MTDCIKCKTSGVGEEIPHGPNAAGEYDVEGVRCTMCNGFGYLDAASFARAFFTEFSEVLEKYGATIENPAGWDCENEAVVSFADFPSVKLCEYDDVYFCADKIRERMLQNE